MGVKRAAGVPLTPALSPAVESPREVTIARGGEGTNTVGPSWYLNPGFAPGLTTTPALDHPRDMTSCRARLREDGPIPSCSASSRWRCPTYFADSMKSGRRSQTTLTTTSSSSETTRCGFKRYRPTDEWLLLTPHPFWVRFFVDDQTEIATRKKTKAPTGCVGGLGSQRRGRDSNPGCHF